VHSPAQLLRFACETTALRHKRAFPRSQLLTLTVQQRLQRGVGLGQIQDLSQAAIAEIKRFDPDGVHDAVKL
jgi:hypothetical protein